VKRARVLLLVVGAVMCVVSVLLFTRLCLINVFDRDDQPNPTSQSVVPPSPPSQEAARFAPTEIAPQQPDQLDVLDLDPPAQNSPHAIAPDAEPPAAESSPATESPVTAEAIKFHPP
jgi:hypothetical protein